MCACHDCSLQMHGDIKASNFVWRHQRDHAPLTRCDQCEGHASFSCDYGLAGSVSGYAAAVAELLQAPDEDDHRMESFHRSRHPAAGLLLGQERCTLRPAQQEAGVDDVCVLDFGCASTQWTAAADSTGTVSVKPLAITMRPGAALGSFNYRSINADLAAAAPRLQVHVLY